MPIKMDSSDTYGDDMRDSLSVEQFCDSTIYQLRGVFSNLRRHRGMDMQAKGVDLTVDVAGLGTIAVDEKAATRAMRSGSRKYMNSLIELTNDRVPDKIFPDDPDPEAARAGWGWYNNPKSETEYYFFMFPSLRQKYAGTAGSIYPEYIDPDDFHCYLTSKRRIASYLASKGLARNRIMQIAGMFLRRDGRVADRGRWLEYRDPKSGLTFMRSVSCARERSVAIALPPYAMEQISIVHADCISGSMSAFSPAGRVSQPMPRFVIGQRLRAEFEGRAYTGNVVSMLYDPPNGYMYRLDCGANFHQEQMFAEF